MSKKTALVTGASSGIGWEFSRQLAQRGYRILAVARREERLQALLAELPGDDHAYRVADLASEEGTQAVAALMNEQRVHLLVNNAGYSSFEPFYQARLSAQQDILAVNCGAVVALAHTFLNQAQRGDALINLASIVSFLPTPAQPMYSASKAFIAALSECLWVEHKARGVYVMALCPGVTESEFISTATGGESDGSTLPGALTQSAPAMVAEALKALDKRSKPVVVTGGANRLMLQLPRLLSRFRLLRVLTALGDPERAL